MRFPLCPWCPRSTFHSHTLSEHHPHLLRPPDFLWFTGQFHQIGNMRLFPLFYVILTLITNQTNATIVTHGRAWKSHVGFTNLSPILSDNYFWNVMLLQHHSRLNCACKLLLWNHKQNPNPWQSRWSLSCPIPPGDDRCQRPRCPHFKHLKLSTTFCLHSIYSINPWPPPLYAPHRIVQRCSNELKWCTKWCRTWMSESFELHKVWSLTLVLLQCSKTHLYAFHLQPQTIKLIVSSIWNWIRVNESDKETDFKISSIAALRVKRKPKSEFDQSENPLLFFKSWNW